jgi:hypothetical protein
VTAPAGRVLGQNPRLTGGITQGMMVHSPSHAHGTLVIGTATIVRDTASIPKDLVPRYLEASCTMLVFHYAFEHCATSPNTMAKATPSSGWRIIASRVEWEGQPMICSSSCSSLSIWLNPPRPGWAISRETPSIVWMTCGGCLLVISRAPTCVLATPGT